MPLSGALRRFERHAFRRMKSSCGPTAGAMQPAILRMRLTVDVGVWPDRLEFARRDGPSAAAGALIVRRDSKVKKSFVKTKS
jgi:hypothetical protein